MIHLDVSINKEVDMTPIQLMSLVGIVALSSVLNCASAATIAPCASPDCAGFTSVTLDATAESDFGAVVGAEYLSAADLTSGTSFARGQSRAAYGVLGASLATAVTGASGTATVTTQASYGDIVRIGSDTLSAGTPVQVELQLWVVGTRVLGPGGFGGFAAVNANVTGIHLNAAGQQIKFLNNLFFENTSTLSTLEDFNQGNTLRTLSFEAAVGDQVQLFAQFQLSAATNAGGSATLDFLDTAHLGFQSASADLAFLGKTGFDYGISAVPLPSTLWLLGPAIVGLLRVRRRASMAMDEA